MFFWVIKFVFPSCQAVFTSVCLSALDNSTRVSCGKHITDSLDSFEEVMWELRVAAEVRASSQLLIHSAFR